jgi:hypothetical protein
MSCNEQKSDPIKHIPKDSLQQQTFFPVTEYIRGQLSDIDNLPVTPLKITESNGRKDSVWMKKEDIRPFAEPFLHPVIDTSNFKDLFTEKSFLDQTINAFTFSYDPTGTLPDTLQLRRWDVYIDPKKNTIKRIYIVKENRVNGELQTLQLTWKSDAWCKITTIIEREGQPPVVKEEMMKWEVGEE